MEAQEPAPGSTVRRLIWEGRVNAWPMSFQLRRSVDVYMGQEGVYSKVEVLRKKRVGSSSLPGTIQTVGSGLKPRMIGFRKFGEESILW